jgi:hypothetical protein
MLQGIIENNAVRKFHKISHLVLKLRNYMPHSSQRDESTTNESNRLQKFSKVAKSQQTNPFFVFK